MAENLEDEAPGVASFPESLHEDTTLLPDPDVDFADLDEQDNSDDPTAFVKPGKKEGVEKKGSLVQNVPQYILGTLVVRVVAARDLEPIQKGGLGQVVFGNGKRASGSGTANPYASVKFGESTQRSSEVYDTLDPIWPRQEAMFMDVSLPASHIAHSDAADTMSFETENPPESNIYKKPTTMLTVALFHAAEVGRTNKYPNKGSLSGDSNDMFMGMASINLQRLLTGRDHTFDGWLQLSGTETSRGSVRVVCEYEPSDPPPRPGDYCRFTRYCSPRDLYPLKCGRQYRIAEVNGDNVLISYTTSEGWVCSFQAHRFMLICEERHHSTVEVAQDEFASMAERLSHSPLVHSISNTVERVAVDGLLSVGEEVVQKGFSLFNRWFTGGVEIILGDVTDATNWDGRHNPDVSERLDLPNLRAAHAEEDDDATGGNATNDYEDMMDSKPAAVSQVALPSLEPEPLPNMPSCPITGFPMIDPVVAADGHTYERSAIARWLATSNKSPMTGSILPHKNLVTNYGLMSSIQEAAARTTSTSRHAGIPSRIEVDESMGLHHVPSMETMETITVTSPAPEYTQRAAKATDDSSE